MKNLFKQIFCIWKNFRRCLAFFIYNYKKELQEKENEIIEDREYNFLLLEEAKRLVNEQFKLKNKRSPTTKNQKKSRKNMLNGEGAFKRSNARGQKNESK